MVEDIDTNEEIYRAYNRRFVATLQKDSLECGAIPNPHVRVNVPKMKIIPYIFHFMFLHGLPNGWGT